MIGILAAVTLSGLVSGEPNDVEKDVVVFNDTKGAVEVRIDGGPAREAPAWGAVSMTLPSFDEHAIQATRDDGHSYGRAFTFSPTNGFFQPPHQHLFCVRIEHSQVESLDPAACWSRVHREHLEG
jgi:hypothetical protein